MLWAGQWLHQVERAPQCSGVTGRPSFFHDFPVLSSLSSTLKEALGCQTNSSCGR